MTTASVDLEKIQRSLPQERPKTFCVAPFLSTMQTPYGKTSPCAYGVTEWELGHLDPKQRWEFDQLNEFRMQYAQDQIPSPCIKCVNEELAGKQSLRQRMLEWFPNSYENFILNGKWQQGPQLISTKVSNVCNLACRSCAAWDTNYYHREGLHYQKEYGTTLQNGNRFIARLPPKHTDYSKFDGIANNVVKLEFYGGETLLNHTHFEFLEYLIACNQSKNVTIFYSTNCTQPITDRFRKIWSAFQKIEFSFSIDHIEKKFEYLRWPATWDTVERNINDMLNLPNEMNTEFSFVVSPCCTINNVYYIDEVIEWANRTVGHSYINMVADPNYLAAHIAPQSVKQAILDHVKSPEVRGFLQIKPYNEHEWKKWLIWTKRQDLYRKQNFAETFPEFYKIIQADWNNTVDLSDHNLNKETMI